MTLLLQHLVLLLHRLLQYAAVAVHRSLPAVLLLHLLPPAGLLLLLQLLLLLVHLLLDVLGWEAVGRCSAI